MKKINFKDLESHKPKIKSYKLNRGFVLLYAVTLAAIFLSLALGIAEVALKEVNFGTSAKNTNNAFFAADTGTEQVLYNDFEGTNLYPAPASGSTQQWGPIYASQLGSDGQSCAIVTITKTTSTDTPPVVYTSVVANGYNTGSGNSKPCTILPNAVNRELDTNY